VVLTEEGVEQAWLMRELLAQTPFDWGVHTGLTRTRQTAGLVLEGRHVHLEEIAALRKMRVSSIEQLSDERIDDDGAPICLIARSLRETCAVNLCANDRLRTIWAAQPRAFIRAEESSARVSGWAPTARSSINRVSGSPRHRAVRSTRGL
jgi:Histidine phosphatase superfamily (branch 1)